MPLTKDQIANYSQAELKERARREVLGQRKPSEKTWVSPHYGDGGWHTTPGCLRFNPSEIKPLGDHILVAIDSEPEAHGAIVKPQIACNQERITRTGTVIAVGPGKWNDKKFRRMPMTLKVGDRVIVGQHSDWESWDVDYEGRGANICIFQEADVRMYSTKCR